MASAVRSDSAPAGRASPPAGGAPTVRRIRADDCAACARAAFVAHAALAARQGHPSEHPTPAFSAALMKAKIEDSGVSGFAAERGGSVVGSVFLNRFPATPVAAVGPLTVDPAAEGSGAGRLLLEAALAEAGALGIDRVRLIQSPAHLRSLALYCKLGFELREPLVLMQPARARPAAETGVRKAGPAEIDDCERLCARVHGFARSGEIRAAAAAGAVLVVPRDDRIAGYTTGIGLRGHAVGESSEDLMALIAAAPSVAGPGFFVPVRNGRLLRRLLADGYRALWPAALMTRGDYREPAGAFLPSIAF